MYRLSSGHLLTSANWCGGHSGDAAGKVENEKLHSLNVTCCSDPCVSEICKLRDFHSRPAGSRDRGKRTIETFLD
jgi:hypothetical protein